MAKGYYLIISVIRSLLMTENIHSASKKIMGWSLRNTYYKHHSWPFFLQWFIHQILESLPGAKIQRWRIPYPQGAHGVLHESIWDVELGSQGAKWSILSRCQDQCHIARGSDSELLNCGMRQEVSEDVLKRQAEAIWGRACVTWRSFSYMPHQRELTSLLSTTWDNSLRWNWNNLHSLYLSSIFTSHFNQVPVFQTKGIIFQRELNIGHCKHKWSES